MASNYNKQIYHQLEEVIIKLDKSLADNKELKENLKIVRNENKNKDAQIMELSEKLAKAMERIEELQEKLDKEISKNRKDSSNSSKPASTDIVPPKKEKTRPNQYNYRTKSGLKKGGQYGHEGHTYKKEDLEKAIKERNLEVKEREDYIRGNSSKEPIIKYKIGIEIKPVIFKCIFRYSENATKTLPKEFQTDVTYDNSIKALSINLDTINVVSLDRQVEFFKVVTDDFLKISKGTLMNFKNEFSKKATVTLQKIEEHLLNKSKMFTDETTTKNNGKKIYARNYSNKEDVLYKIHKHKGHDPIKADNILTRYIGGIMADHDTTIDSYGTERYECNVHVGRYATEIEQLVPDVKWAPEIKNLLFRANNSRKIAKAFGCEKFTEEKIKEYSDEYDKILELALKENKEIISKTFRGKAERLRKRLLKNKENHIAFLKDFNVDFSNNLSEQDLRIFKIKTKVSGGFRSLKGAQMYADSLSIIRTAKKRQMNPMQAIEKILNNQVLFA